jgi:hypothetical protein
LLGGAAHHIESEITLRHPKRDKLKWLLSGLCALAVCDNPEVLKIASSLSTGGVQLGVGKGEMTGCVCRSRVMSPVAVGGAGINSEPWDRAAKEDVESIGEVFSRHVRADKCSGWGLGP